MTISTLIFLTLFLTTVETKSDVKICTFNGNYIECVLTSGRDNFNVTADVHKDLLWQVTTLILSVGKPNVPYEPPKDSPGIVYPDWSLMPIIHDIEIQFYLKGSKGEFTLNLDNFQYLPATSFKGVKELGKFNLTSNSQDVKFEVGLLSDSHHLNLLWVEGCTISAGESWANLRNVSDLRLIGNQLGNVDIGRLPLDTLTSLYLSLNKIEGINGSIAQKMTKLRHLSIAVTQPQSLDWSFINALALQLQTLNLDGCNLGNISSKSFPRKSTIRYLTLSRSANTEFIDAYSFSGDYEAIELNGMDRLVRIEANPMLQCYNLLNLTITNMKTFTAMPTSLGEEVRPKWVQLANNPMLSVVPASFFEEMTSSFPDTRIAEVNVLGTKLDTICPCQASYLAAMSVVGNTKIHSNCLNAWVKNGKCQQGDNCWSFAKVCNETCLSANNDPFYYECKCAYNQMLLPDEYSCVPETECNQESENPFRCRKYNATCHRHSDYYVCRCDFLYMWDSIKMACVKNNQVPLVSPTNNATTTKTAMTIIPMNTTKTAMTIIPMNTTKTAVTIIPMNTTKTAMTIIPMNTTKTAMTIIPMNTTKTAVTIIPMNTTKTAMTIIPMNTTKTAMTIIPMNTTKTAVTIIPMNTTAMKVKSLESPTAISPTQSLIPPFTMSTSKNHPPISIQTENYTMNTLSIRTVTSRNLSNSSSTHSPTTHTTHTSNPPTLANTSSLPLWEISLIVAASAIAVIILFIVLLVLLYCYRKKKTAVRVFPRQNSPNLLDSDPGI